LSRLPKINKARIQRAALLGQGIDMRTASQTSSWLLSAALCGYTAVATAVDAADSPLEEIVVTAQRRAENLQTVPISVSVLQGVELQRLQITSPAELSQFTPSLHIYAEDIGSEFYTVRGIGRTSEDLSADPGVAVFLNEIYLPRQAEANVGLFDIERVEVLRGPQGTLYGKNATAGAINIATRAPSDQFSGYADVTAGNYGRINVDGAVTGQLAKGLDGRLAVDSENRDGLYRNTTTGDRANNIDRQGVRGTLDYRAIDALSVVAVFDWERAVQHGNLKSIFTDVPGTVYEFFGHNPFTGNPRPGITPQTEGSDPFAVAAGVNGGQGIETYGALLNVRYRMADVDFVSITGLRHEIDYSVEDDGRTPEIAAYSTSRENTWSGSEELKLMSNAPNVRGSANRVSWTAGVYYFHEQGSKLAGIYYDVVPFSGITYFDQSLHTNSLAAFADVRYRVIDPLSITLGVRYTSETKSFGVNAFSVPVPGEVGSDGSTPFLDNGNFVTASSARWNKFSPRLVLDYQLTDGIFAYASYSEGFKSGGFDGEPSSPPNMEFQPEEVKNYEAGLKAEFFGRLRTNVAVFYSDYNNLQLQVFDANGAPSTGTADARSKGIELEVAATVADNLHAKVGLSLTDPTYKNYISVLPAIGTTFDRSGQTIGEVPKHQFNALLDYKIPLAVGAVIVQPDIVSVGRTITEFGSLWSPAYTKGDLRAVYEPISERWNVALWCKNITNKLYYEGGGPVSKYNTDTVRVGLVADPRTYGITLHVQF
jgi:iron complex outermembrane receptor protein